MPRVSNIELLKQVKQPTITIRTFTKVEDLPMLIGQSYGRIAAYLKELGELMTDVPFVAYHNMDMNNLDVEIGFKVSAKLPDRGEIKAAVLPESTVVFCMYRGPYNEIEAPYNEMAKWITANGYIPSGSSYEYYYNGPESPECPKEELLTKIIMPIEKPAGL